jgi:quercetin dioxygenase-like cupin family protein
MLFSSAREKLMEKKLHPCEQVVPIEQEPRHHLVIANNFVRGFAVEIAPHDLTLCHHHEHEYLMYVVGGAQIVSAPRDSQPTTHSYRDGDCELSPPGLVHVVQNLRDTSFRNLLVELLPEAAELRRGSDLKAVAGDVLAEAIFEEERISVWSLQMKGDAEVEVYGPAIVATPYGDQLLPEAAGNITVKPDDVSSLGWIPMTCRAVLRSSPTTSERAILFQMGCTEEQPWAVRKTGR